MAHPSSLPHVHPDIVAVGQTPSIILSQQAPIAPGTFVFEEKVIVRPYVETDFKEISKIYRIAFAESPWNEYKKCTECHAKYTQKAVAALSDSPVCRRCQNPLMLCDFWGDEDIWKDLSFALSQPFPVNLVAESGNELIGMIWGCLIPLNQFAFVKAYTSPETHYLDDIAVRPDKRKGGVGTMLGSCYLDEIGKMGIKEVVLRTDERNEASLALFKKLGFLPLVVDGKPLRDPGHFHRIYLKKDNI